LSLTSRLMVYPYFIQPRLADWHRRRHRSRALVCAPARYTSSPRFTRRIANRSPLCRFSMINSRTPL
jgi:hypothetical protein